jgi:hypothetical protein
MPALSTGGVFLLEGLIEVAQNAMSITIVLDKITGASCLKFMVNGFSTSRLITCCLWVVKE